MALREVERARSPLWVSQAAAALVVLSMVLPLDGASSPHRLDLFSPPARSSRRRLVRLFTGWFVTGWFVSSPAGSSRHWLILFASRHRLVLLSTTNCSLSSALLLGRDVPLSLCSANAVVPAVAASCVCAVSAMRLI